MTDDEPAAYRYRVKFREEPEWRPWTSTEVDPNDWTWPSYWSDMQCEPLYSEAVLTSLREEVAELRAAIATPEAVRANILRGTIPIPDDLVWLHDTNGPVAALRIQAEAAEAEVARMRELVDFAVRWAWRDSAHLSDTERLSAIKYHPTIREMAIKVGYPEAVRDDETRARTALKAQQ